MGRRARPRRFLAPAQLWNPSGGLPLAAKRARDLERMVGHESQDADVRRAVRRAVRRWAAER